MLQHKQFLYLIALFISESYQFSELQLDIREIVTLMEIFSPITNMS